MEYLIQKRIISTSIVNCIIIIIHSIDSTSQFKKGEFFANVISRAENSPLHAANLIKNPQISLNIPIMRPIYYQMQLDKARRMTAIGERKYSVKVRRKRANQSQQYRSNLH